VEGLRLVHRIPVRGTHLIGVRVLLSAPARTVPVLSVQCVTTGEFAESFFLEVGVLAESGLSLKLGEGKSGLVLEPDNGVSVREDGVRLGLWGYITGTGSGSIVVLGMVERVGLVSSLSSITTRERLTSVVLLGNELGVESGGGEGVGLEVNGPVEDVSRLLGNRLLDMVVRLDLRTVASVPGDTVRLAWGRSLCAHVSSAGSVEIGG